MKVKYRLLLYALGATILAVAVGVLLNPTAGLLAAVLVFGAAIASNLVALWLQEFVDHVKSERVGGVQAKTPTLVLRPGTQRPRRRRAWVMIGSGATIVLLISLAIGAVYYFNPSPAESQKLILVADFDEPDQTQYRVTDTLVQTLAQAFEDYPSVRVERIDRKFRAGDNEIVREQGNQRNATIVIWGWYGQTDDSVALSAHFEVLPHMEILPEFSSEVGGSLQVLQSSELKSFAMQIDLSHEITYLSLVVVGLTNAVDDDLDAAISNFSDALKISPPKTISQTLEREPIYFYRARAYFLKRDYDKAIDDFTQLIDTNPSSTTGYIGRGDCYLALSLYNLRSEYDRAIADYDQAIKLDPEAPQAFVSRGIAYLQKGEYDQAITDFTQAIELDANDEFTFNSRAYCYVRRGEYDQAIVDYDHAIRLDPKDATKYYNRGTTYAIKRQYDQAIADFTQAIELDADNVRAYQNRGNAYLSKAQYDRAIADYNHALKLDPKDATTHYALAHVNKLIGKDAEAISGLEKVLELTDDPELRSVAEQELRVLRTR